MEYFIAVVIGIVAGFMGGMFGIGGGIVMIPAMVYLLGYSQQMAQGTTLAAMVLPIGIFAAYEYHKNGFVNIPVAAVIALMFVGGSIFGSKIAIGLDAALLKRLFAVLLVLVGIKMFFGK